MTEVGHGLDIANLETTATLLPSGDFILNTPTPSAAKYVVRTLPPPNATDEYPLGLCLLPSPLVFPLLPSFGHN